MSLEVGKEEDGEEEEEEEEEGAWCSVSASDEASDSVRSASSLFGGEFVSEAECLAIADMVVKEQTSSQEDEVKNERVEQKREFEREQQQEEKEDAVG